MRRYRICAAVGLGSSALAYVNESRPPRISHAKNSSTCALLSKCHVLHTRYWPSLCCLNNVSERILYKFVLCACLCAYSRDGEEIGRYHIYIVSVFISYLCSYRICVHFRICVDIVSVSLWCVCFHGIYVLVV